MTDTPDATGTAPMNSGQNKSERGVILISYPKIVFLWPTWLVTLLCGIYMAFWGQGADGAIEVTSGTVACCWTFLIVLAINMQVLAFDFPRATSLTLLFVIVALILGGALVVVNFPNVFPSVTAFLKKFHPVANSTFYFFLAGMLAIMYAAVFINARFDYWEVRPNELLHHHGILSDLERFSSPNLRIDKEINDIFEYLLLQSGRLILHPSNERRAIVLDNVFFISSKEKSITKMLGALQVQVREADSQS
ncbi:MAG: hypothetical protein KDA58_01900 [Planctomycetaceae bacterium]|nr:hypothetical protein [Planctomycetaceae bacterium]